ncbi:MAG: methyltransferase domain-containing protein [Timaviella obliquedivisa GSE-PSE-MK23-08B]|jgi:SAM-dependent methyltransferase/archaellum component FlaC|nr:methyltransferase domain-containing protein [Timaviella obliquedivisa GSE-PSE-MK23-08B]
MDLASDNLSGPWKKEMYADRLPDQSAFDEGFIQSVLDICQPTTVLDLGCGQGYFVKWLREKRVEAWGVEGEDLGTSFKAPGYQIQQDLSQPFDLEKTYDVVMCTEVVEHIPEACEETVFNNIARHTHRYLVFSGATPGQGGTGHINEKPEAHWFSCLVSRGFKLLHEASVQARLVSTLDWYVKNISIWELQKTQENSLEDVLAIAMQDSYLISHAVSAQKLVREQQQVVTLASQLHQAQTELHDSRTHFHQTQLELHEAQTQSYEATAQLHQTQVELYEATTQLHQTQVELYEATTQLHQTQVELYEANAKLHQTQVERYQIKEQLGETQSDLENTKNQIWELQTNIEVLNHRLTRIRAKRQEIRVARDNAQNEINAMQTSKFWKFRKGWFKLKRFLRLSTPE